MSNAPSGTDAPDSVAGPPSPRGRWASALGFAAGMLLLAAAAWAVSRQGDAFRSAWAAAREAGWPMIVSLLVLPLVSWVLAAGTFWVLTGRYGRVGRAEMMALIGSAWLLNYLPMRMGMAGRVAYHKAVNGIRARDSLLVVVHATLCTAGAVAVLLAATAAARSLGAGRFLPAFLALPALAFAAGMLIARRGAGAGTPPRGAERPRPGHAWRLWGAILFRYLEMLVWTARYWIAFTVTGHPLDITGAAAVTGASQAAMLAPVQLGVREWAVGLAAAVVPYGAFDPLTGGVPGVTIQAMAPGLMADMVNRAAELLIAVPVGLISAAWLWRRRTRRAPGMEPSNGEAAPCE